MTRSRVGILIVISGILSFTTEGNAQAPANPNDGLLLPVALGFLLKIVLVVLGGMVKLMFLGFTSLGISGIALVLGILFLKNQGLAIAPWAPHHRIDNQPVWYQPVLTHHRLRSAKQLQPPVGLNKPEPLHSVPPGGTQLEPLPRDSHRDAESSSKTNNATYADVHALAN